MQEGKNAGVWTALVAVGYGGVQAKRAVAAGKLHPDFVLDSVAALRSLFDPATAPHNTSHAANKKQQHFAFA